jgi:hypothetical protein
LTERIELGQFGLQEAIDFARAIFFESPQSLLRMTPRPV